MKEVISQHGSLFFVGKNRDKERLGLTRRVSRTVDSRVNLPRIQSSPSLVWREGKRTMSQYDLKNSQNKQQKQLLSGKILLVM